MDLLAHKILQNLRRYKNRGQNQIDEDSWLEQIWIKPGTCFQGTALHFHSSNMLRKITLLHNLWTTGWKDGRTVATDWQQPTREALFPRVISKIKWFHAHFNFIETEEDSANFFPFFCYFERVVEASFVNIYHMGWGREGGGWWKKNRGSHGFQGEKTGEWTMSWLP